MLDAILVARDDSAAGLAKKDALLIVVQHARHSVEAFSQQTADKAFLARPDRRSDSEDIGGRDLVSQGTPVVAVRAVFGHVRVNSERNLMRSLVYLIDRDAVAGHFPAGTDSKGCVSLSAALRFSKVLKTTAIMPEKSVSVLSQRRDRVSLITAGNSCGFAC